MLEGVRSREDVPHLSLERQACLRVALHAACTVVGEVVHAEVVSCELVAVLTHASKISHTVTETLVSNHVSHRG